MSGNSDLRKEVRELLDNYDVQLCNDHDLITDLIDLIQGKGAWINAG